MLGQLLEILQPGYVRVGAGEAARLGQTLREHRLARPLIVADAFNATKLEMLGLPHVITCVAVRPEPD